MIRDCIGQVLVCQKWQYPLIKIIGKCVLLLFLVTISGPQLAFYGMPLELICRANFSSPEAKRDPSITLEWYHNGVRRRPSRVQSGGTYVTRRWVDSNLLESRLLITWTSEKEAGRWHCVDQFSLCTQFISI